MKSDGARCMRCKAPLDYSTGVYVIHHESWCEYRERPNETYPVELGKDKPSAANEDKKQLFFDGWMKAHKSTIFGDLPMPEGEYKFHPKRRWQFDWAWPEYMVAVEVDGRAKWVKGGGSHAQDTDREKHNAAAELGWTTLRYSTDMLKRDLIGCVEQVIRIIHERM